MKQTKTKWTKSYHVRRDRKEKKQTKTKWTKNYHVRRDRKEKKQTKTKWTKNFHVLMKDSNEKSQCVIFREKRSFENYRKIHFSYNFDILHVRFLSEGTRRLVVHLCSHVFKFK